MAFWPANEAIGLRVLDALDEGQEEYDCRGDEYGNRESLLSLLVRKSAGRRVKHVDKPICRLLGLKTIDELGEVRRASACTLHHHLFQREYCYGFD